MGTSTIFNLVWAAFRDGSSSKLVCQQSSTVGDVCLRRQSVYLFTHVYRCVSTETGLSSTNTDRLRSLCRRDHHSVITIRLAVQIFYENFSPLMSYRYTDVQFYTVYVISELRTCLVQLRKKKFSYNVFVFDSVLFGYGVCYCSPFRDDRLTWNLWEFTNNNIAENMGKQTHIIHARSK